LEDPVLNGLKAAMLAAGAVALLFGATSASGNNDPHRQFLPAAPFDVPAAVCGFPIHVEIPVNREYGTFSTGADGSTIVKVTGSLVEALTNVTTGKTITVNASGPGTLTFPANSSLGIVDAQGRDIFFVTNGAAFGLPNYWVTDGLLKFTIDFTTATIVEMPRKPHLAVDVCAALS
jgi:hypothetical protein